MRKPISEHTLIVIAGPTAVGKTRLSIDLTLHFSTEIISADSRQFYKELKIGTAPPEKEDLARVPHHFIGHLSVSDDYNVYKYETEAIGVLASLFSRHQVVITVGGSGLYINAMCKGIDELPDPDPDLRSTLQDKLFKEGIASLQRDLERLDPAYYAEADTSNPKRLIRALEVCLSTGIPFSQLRQNQPKQRNFNVIMIGLNRDRGDLFARIGVRTDQMIASGLVDEAESLIPLRHMNALNTVGYKEIFRYLDGLTTLPQAITDIKTNTRRYAKRQLTWFRKEPDIHWFHPDDFLAICRFLEDEMRKGPVAC